ncbi:Imm30 family immunity protein [Pseudomonas sp. LF19]|uniref:Imm30 family immunity protein n=1 Tax=Pseudomonas sp. LF19 TaxID=2899115 RepID=UPI001F3BA720|nr:Imm30 family immunity protein [Pseudomonas sp. LF19]MCE5982953.1 immunity 30 family protein [Pseudomonas sp. LF19]
MSLTQDLENSARLSNAAEVGRFSATLKAMAQTRDKQYLKVMLSHLDDDCEYGDLMKEIIGMAESFDPASYVEAVVEVTDTLKSKASDWLESIHYRIFNSPDYTKLYRTALAHSANRAAVESYLKDFLAGNPEKQSEVDSVLAR